MLRHLGDEAVNKPIAMQRYRLAGVLVAQMAQPPIPSLDQTRSKGIRAASRNGYTLPSSGSCTS